DLENVSVAGDELDIRRRHHLGDDLESGFLAGLGENLQSVFAETSEFVWRCSRLKSAATKDGCTGSLDGAGSGHGLFFGFNRARARHQRNIIATYSDAVTEVDNRFVRMEVPACQLVLL